MGSSASRMVLADEPTANLDGENAEVTPGEAPRYHPWDWQSASNSECVTCDGVPASCSSPSRFLH